MPTFRPVSPLAVPAPSPEPSVRSIRTPEEQQAHAQAKKLKKERKAERLRFFFGWCQGCRAMGNGF